MSMLTPIVEQWNNTIAPNLFSLRDSSTGVATQWRAASSAFQDMEAMRDERITHEMSCVLPSHQLHTAQKARQQHRSKDTEQHS